MEKELNNQNRQNKKKMSKGKKITLIVTLSLVGFILLNILGEVIATPFIYNAIFPKVETPDYNITPGLVDYNEIKDSYPRYDISFKSGDNNLTGFVYEVDSPKGLVIVSHGMKSGADSYLSHETYFVEHGYDVFAYNCTGTYSSEGDSLKGFPQSILDLSSALTYINSNDSLKNLKKCLFGHSWGAYANTEILNLDYDIASVASISGANDAEEIVINSASDTVGSFLATLGKPFVIAYQRILFGEYSNMKAIDGINKSNIPVLIAHGEDDSRFPIDRDSIYHLKDNITNNKVQYYLGTDSFGGHSSILYSEVANNYQKQVYNDYEALKAINPNLTYEDKVDFYNHVDNHLYSEVNPLLMNQIITMFDAA